LHPQLYNSRKAAVSAIVMTGLDAAVPGGMPDAPGGNE
jgi:hypothetical protein